MFKPEEIKMLTNVVKVCCGIAGFACFYILMKLAIILEG